jgi:hypothetical protein
MAYECRILADSISPAGHRITSFEVTFPRIVLAEMNTHCMLARNSASSRAIPVAKRIAALMDMFVPEAFGRNQKGMQPGEALAGEEDAAARLEWETAAWEMVRRALNMERLSVHKQYANRLLEFCSFHTAVITATDLDNFFHLRVNPLAQGEIQKAAQLMQAGRDNSQPRALNYGEWHLPYVEPGEAFDLEVNRLDPVKISVARCARVSYLTQNGVRDPQEDLALYERLVNSGHMSPLEHVARPMDQFELDMVETWDVSLNDGPTLRVRCRNPAVGMSYAVESDGVTLRALTSVRGPLHYSGKLNGWISRRAFVPNEWDMLGAKK